MSRTLTLTDDQGTIIARWFIRSDMTEREIQDLIDTLPVRGGRAFAMPSTRAQSCAIVHAIRLAAWLGRAPPPALAIPPPGSRTGRRLADLCALDPTFARAVLAVFGRTDYWLSIAATDLRRVRLSSQPLTVFPGGLFA